MFTRSLGPLLWGSLVGFSCAQFELPQKFTEPTVLADGGSGDFDAGVFSTDFSSCPTLPTPARNADGGVAPPFASIKVELQTSIGLVDVFTAIPLSCPLPATATALAANGSVVMPQPAMTWSTGDAGVLTVDAEGTVLGVAEGLTSLDVTADGKSGTRAIWVGGDAVLSIAPLAGYGGFPDSLHATATAGQLIGPPVNFLKALFAMRTGIGLAAVERALFIQAVSAPLVEGQMLTAQLTYREFGERLPGRVRDFSATAPVVVEQVLPGRVRLAFSDVVLRGPNGAASFSGHLEFSTP